MVMRLWSFLLPFLLITVSASAQEISLGLIGGGRYTTTALNEAIQYNGETLQINSADLSLDPAAGAFLKLKLGGLILQPEVHYARSRAFLEVQHSQGAPQQTLTVHRVDLPFLAGLEFFKAVRLYGGLNASFIQSSEWTYDEPFWSTITLRDRTAVWSTLLGAGINIGRFTLDARFERQLGHLYFNSTLGGQQYVFKGQQEAVSAYIGFLLFK